MTDQFASFSGNNYEGDDVLDSAVLVEEGIVWHQEACEEHVAVNYADVSLTDNGNESYITADEDDNTTQYLSVIDSTNETILDDMNIESAEQHIGEADNGESFDIAEMDSTVKMNEVGENPFIYRVEGSDDMYAVEVAYDEHGNIQRYQYKLRQNDNGEFEGVPGTMQFLAIDNILNELTDLNPNEAAQPDEVEETSQNTFKLLIKQEYAKESILSHIEDATEAINDQLQEDEENASLSYEEEAIDDVIDTKADIIESRYLSTSIHKREELDINETEDVLENDSSHFPHNSFENVSADDDMDETLQSEEVSPELYESYLQHEVNKSASTEHVDDNETYEQLLVEQCDLSDAGDKVNHDITPENEILGGHNMEKVFTPAMENIETSSLSNSDMLVSQDQLEYLDDNSSKSGSDTDDYHIVEGIHVTGDEDMQNLSSPEKGNTTHEHSEQQHLVQTHVLKMHQPGNRNQGLINNMKIKRIIRSIADSKANKNLTYLIVQHPEKENVVNVPHLTTNKVTKLNPRSVLKTSVSSTEEKKERKTQLEDKTDKRLIRNKGAMQAKLFHNFISKTTILQAPIRQERLPRKQTIKPVTRSDEEIIVQEVVVSSNGFIETLEDGILKTKTVLKPIDIVQLSDSDDDYDPKKDHKRKKKNRKRRSKHPEIVISDSEDDVSDNHIVHIDLSADSDDERNNRENKDEENNQTTIKRLRGRPRKSQAIAIEEPKSISHDGQINEESAEIDNSVLKKKRGRPLKTSVGATPDDKKTKYDQKKSELSQLDTSKKLRRHSNEQSNKKIVHSVSSASSQGSASKSEIKCSKCPKSFPSQGSLRTHMQFHNFHEFNNRTLREQQTTKRNLVLSTSSDVSKYKCTLCGETFKNNALLVKHVNAHKSLKELGCGMCKKIFADTAQLANHKRSHIKEQMFLNTTPSKIISNFRSNKLFKSPVKVDIFKCTYCPKMFNSQLTLNNHAKTHNCYSCKTCRASFTSKLTLEDHVRQNCVKTKSPTKLLSAKVRIRASLPKTGLKLQSAHKSSSVSSASASCIRYAKKISSLLKCDKCVMIFSTHTSLLKHKVEQHGLCIPNKSLLSNADVKSSVLNKKGDGGIGYPSNAKLRRAYAQLQSKLENF